jgi:large subunit ribosomal protein L25
LAIEETGRPVIGPRRVLIGRRPRNWSRCAGAVFVMSLEKIMKTSFELVAEFRETQGKGASRRLRHEGKVPAILYGGHADARTLTLNHQKLLIMLDNERFYSTILSLKVGEQSQAAILKDVQRHPFKNAIVHVDFQRVEENEKIRISIPLHFTGAAVSPGVKTQGGIVSHMRNEAEVTCLPKDLPEFIEVDISGLSLNESIHLSQLKIPPGVTLVELAKEDAAVVAIHSPRAEEPEPTAAAAGAPAAEGAAAAAPAAGAAGADAGKKAEPAKKEEAKKEPAKKDAKK